MRLRIVWREIGISWISLGRRWGRGRMLSWLVWVGGCRSSIVRLPSHSNFGLLDLVKRECVADELQTVVAMPEYSQSAYRFGDYVAKFGVFPLSAEQKAISKEIIP